MRIPGWAVCGAVGLMALQAGCAMPPYKKSKDLTAILEAYRKQSAEAPARAEQRPLKGVRRWSVTRPVGDGPYLVSADLEDATLPKVLRRLLDETSTQYVFDVFVPPGSVTARFENLPALKALNILLEPHDLEAGWVDGLMHIRPVGPKTATRGAGAGRSEGAYTGAASGPGSLSGPTSPPGSAGSSPGPPHAGGGNPHADPPSPGGVPGGGGALPSGSPPAPAPGPAGGVRPGGPPPPGAFGPGPFRGMGGPPPMAALPSTIEVPLKHLDLATASSLIGGLFPGTVRFGGQPYSNSIFLSGPAEQVTIAARVLNQSDRTPFHVVIEALVVEFNSEVLQELGTDIVGLASGAISGLTTGFGTNTALTFTYTKGAGNTATFTALINALVEEDRARVISRPYVATLSGKPSTINITRDRYVLVPSIQGGLATTTPTPVSSGIVLNITPTVSQDEMVRMDVQVQDSAFLPASENVVIEVDKKQASTSMLVESGQSIVIGGLFLDRVTYGESGFPWLRHVPLLNLLFGKEVGTAQRQEVVVYVTPYIWAPGPEAPLPAKDALSQPEGGRNPIVLDRPQP